LRLMVHRKPLAPDLLRASSVEVVSADLAQPSSLAAAVEDVDAIVHFAGVLFRPFPERFLPTTNHQYVVHLTQAALKARVGRIILVSFPHVEGETTPDSPGAGALDGVPVSVHAQTRLAAERHLLKECARTETQVVILRSGLIYGKGVLMIEAGRKLMRRRLMGVWRRPTWIHPLSLPDFLACLRASVEKPGLSGIYPIADDLPLTLQDFLDRLARHWGYPQPWRAPARLFYAAGLACELWGALWGVPAPLTRDFIRIGMVSHVCDTRRMRAELMAGLAYPTLDDGLPLL